MPFCQAQLRQVDQWLMQRCKIRFLGPKVGVAIVEEVLAHDNVAVANLKVSSDE